MRIYKRLLDELLAAETINKIRHCLNTGLVLDTEAFREQVAALHINHLDLALGPDPAVINRLNVFELAGNAK